MLCCSGIKQRHWKYSSIYYYCTIRRRKIICLCQVKKKKFLNKPQRTKTLISNDHQFVPHSLMYLDDIEYVAHPKEKLWWIDCYGHHLTACFPQCIPAGMVWRWKAQSYLSRFGLKGRLKSYSWTSGIYETHFTCQILVILCSGSCDL